MIENKKDKYRLVKSVVGVELKLDIKIKLKLGQVVLQGVTTGIDTNGIGVRVNLYKHDISQNKEILISDASTREILEDLMGAEFKISFESRKYSFMDVFGNLIRVEDSRDKNFSHFVALKFQGGKKGLLSSDLSSLLDYIEMQSAGK